MIYYDSVLVQLVRLIDRLPAPSSYPDRPRGRGRPRLYPDALFLKAHVIMTVRRLHRVGELLAVLQEPTQEMTSLRELLHEEGASLPGAPSRGGFAPYPIRCRRGSAFWGATW